MEHLYTNVCLLAQLRKLKEIVKKDNKSTVKMTCQEGLKRNNMTLYAPIVPITWELLKRRNDSVKSGQLVEFSDTVPSFIRQPRHGFVRLIFSVQHDSAAEQKRVFSRDDFALRIQYLDAHVKRKEELVLLE